MSSILIKSYLIQEFKLLYAIIGIDHPDTLELRQQARPEHLKRLEQLQAEGRLVLAGPFPAIDSPDPGPAGFAGSLIVAEFPSFPAACAWVEGDPYAKAGVYAQVDVHPFKQVLPTPGT